MELDEMTMLTNTDIESHVCEQREFANGFSARRAEAPAFSFAANCVKPERVHRAAQHARGDRSGPRANNGVVGSDVTTPARKFWCEA
jgi:hypothetical protein